MELNERIHGFRIERIRDLKDCGGTLYEMIHEQTGAQLCWLKRDEVNKTFTCTFKTLPEDDTGVFHILEHSVLNGSKKYPVREPFVELLKSSLQTYLNAFTYPDKTMYPVASRNPKDFMNLVSVYMDAVFAPAIYENPMIFQQEGWHYEIHDENDMPLFKGVVLNEMKGAFSSVDEVMVDELNRMLFPDNCYRFVSGGDPEHITDLTYEQFIDTHRRFYHPSNARIFLDGDMDIDAVLAFINDEYFCHYEKEDMSFVIPMQKPVNAQSREIHYEIDAGEGTEDKTQIAVAKIVSSYDDIVKNTAWNILASILTASNDALLKKEIIDRGLAQDVELDLFDGIQQAWAVLNLRNTNAECRDEALQVLKDTAKRLCEGGLNHDQISAFLNQVEFRYREKREPSGLMYAQRAMNSWLYEGDPALYLSMSDVFGILRQKLEEGYFEQLLAEFLLDDANLCTLTVIPDPSMAAQRIARENAKLAAAKESWGSDVRVYAEATEKLENWQSVPDSEEQLNTLPRLSLADVERKPQFLPYEETKISGVPVLVYPQETGGIVYMTMYFNLAGVRREELPVIRHLAALLTELPTEKYTVEQLQQEIMRDLGTLSFSLTSYSPEHRNDCVIPMLCVNVSALNEKFEKCIDLIEEIIYHTKFEPERILPLVKQENEGFRQALIGGGHAVAMMRAGAHCSAEGVFKEYTAGYETGKYMKELEADFENRISDEIAAFEMYRDILFSKARLTISISSRPEDALKDLIGRLHTVDAQQAYVHYPLLENRRESIRIPAGIAYTGMVNNLRNAGSEYDPKMQVMAHILTYVWLWQEVRVKGGAYGTGFSVNPNSNIGGYSYRDPDPANAMSAVRNAAECLRSMAEDEDLEQLIIGTISGFDPLQSYPSRMRSSDSSYFRKISYEQSCAAREKILNTTVSDLKSFADVLEKAMADSSVCVVTSQDILSSLQEELIELPSLL